MTASGTSPSARRHKDEAADLGAVPVAVITVSDTRTEDTDESGRYLRDAIDTAGHRMVEYTLVPDDADEIESALSTALSGPARVVILSGGTGIAPRDGTVEVVSTRLDRDIPGFGELFRALSYEEIGSAAMLSRAVAGTVDDRVVVSLPGSPDGVRLAWTRLVAPELRHMVDQLDR